MSKRDLLADFEGALTDEERSSLAEFASEVANTTSNLKEVQGRFFAWAGPIAARIGESHAGSIWGRFVGQHKPRKIKKEVQPLPALADALPYPLGLKLRQLLQANLRRQEGASEPQLAFDLCAVMGVIVRLAALITIRSYVETGKKNAALNQLIVEKLRAPSDGGWLEIAQRLAKALAKSDSEPPVSKVVRTALGSKPQLAKNVQQRAKGATTTAAALQALVKFRNDLVHGEPQSADDIARAMALLEVAARGFSGLADYRLEVKHAGRTWSLNGAVPRPIDTDIYLPEDDPCLVHADAAHPPLSLSPLLRFRASEEDSVLDVDFDELFFLNAGSLERLSYIGYRAAGQVDGKSLGSYEAFRDFMGKIPTLPIPSNPRIDFSGLAEFHSRLFVGRSAVLEELTTIVRQRSSQYAVMKALAGMGKSAIFATLLQAVRNQQLEAAQRTSSAADGLIDSKDRWAFHFCMPTDGRNSPTVALRSLIAQVCDAFEDFKRDDWLSHDLDQLKDEKFPGLLVQASDRLGDDERLVVVIDALDEGIGAEKESVPSCIPAGDYPGVVFLVSYRVDQEATNSRVEKQLTHLAEDRLPVLASANPLAGLSLEDVHRFLEKVAALQGNTDRVPEATQDAVWAAAIKDAKGNAPAADPFYLRFVADGVQAGAIRLPRAETVPESLDDAFEEMWIGLPADRDFLCHRVLLTLAIMREYGDDELFAALFNRERDDERLAPNDVASVRVKAGKLLVYDGDRYGLFHDRFRTFLVGEQNPPHRRSPRDGLMPRVRPATARRLHARFAQAAMAWTPDTPEGSLRDYTEKHGVAHLLWTDRKDDAERRMLDLHFMAAFANAWPTVVEPLAAWRLVGLEQMLTRLACRAQTDSELYDATDALESICRFLRDGSLFNESTLALHQLVAQAHERQGRDEKLRIAAQGRVGTVLMEIGRFDEAEAILREAAVLFQSAGDTLDPDFIEILNELAVVLGRTERYSEALPLITQVRKDFLQVLGAKSEQYLLASSSVAWCLMKLSRYDEAEALLRAAIEEGQTTLGDSHPRVTEMFAQFATHLRLKGCYGEVSDILSAQLPICRRQLGQQHPTYRTLCNEWGLLCLATERYGEAEVAFQELIAIEERFRGGSGAVLLMNLSVMYSSQGRFADAREWMAKARAKANDEFCQESPSYLMIQHEYAVLVFKTGANEQAESLMRDVLEGRERVLGLEHRDTLNTISHLVSFYMDEGRLDEAEPLHLRALEAQERTLGKEHPDTLTSVNILANLYADQGRYEEAEPLYLRALEAQERTLGKEHPDALISVNNLANLYVDQGRYEEAELYYTRLLDGWCDPTTWKHHWACLGVALCTAGKGHGFSKAEAVISDLVDLLGEEHDRVAKGREKIAAMKAALEKS